MSLISTVFITGGDSTTLRELDVSWNVIGDIGISLITQWLLPNKTLTKLNVARCNLSVKGTVLAIIFIDVFKGWCMWIIVVNLTTFRTNV